MSTTTTLCTGRLSTTARLSHYNDNRLLLGIMDLFLLPYFDHFDVNYLICNWNFLVPTRYLLTPEMEGSYCPSWTTTAISMMILLRHWWINLDNYFVNFVYLLSTGLIIRVTVALLTQALAYLVRGLLFQQVPSLSIGSQVHQ